jgi:outer membrane immunogenic protein
MLSKAASQESQAFHSVKAIPSQPHRWLRTAGVIAAFALSMGVSAIGTAHAADLDAPMEALRIPDATPMPAFNWSGAYLGGTVGYGWGSDRTTERVNGVFLQQFDLSPSGMLGGVYAGYNHQMNGFVIGVEVDAVYSDVGSTFLDPPGAPPFVGDPGASGEMRMNWQGSARARLGYAFDRFLVFGTGGWALAEHEATYTNQTSLVAETFSGTQDTWTVGGGLEYAVTDNLIGRIEYRYTPFSSVTHNSVTAFPGFGITGEQEPILHDVRVGLGYKF